MKKQIPSTFILNADEKKYFFVEGKISSLYGPIYHVYYDSKEKPALYTAKNFVEEHGTNSKISVIDFVKDANFALTPLHGSDERIDEAYNTFNDIYLKIKSNGLKKSVIKKIKRNLVSAISTYNEVKHMLPSEPEISYQDDYDLIISFEKTKTIEEEKDTEERKVVKRIEEGYENVKGMQRILKKVS